MALINMALEQRQQNPLLLEYNPNFPNNNSLNVTQLIEERIYEDGTFEQKFASTSIAFYSNKPNGTLEMLPAPLASKPIYRGKYDIAITFTAYYTKNSLGSVRLDYCSTVFQDAGSNPVYVTKIQMSTHGIRGPLEPQIERYRTINNPSTGSTYTLNSDDTRYYDGSGLQSLYCGAVYHFSDGTKTADTYIMIILA